MSRRNKAICDAHPRTEVCLRRLRHGFAASLATGLIFAAASNSFAAANYSITTLVNFNITNGSNPSSALIKDANGNYFGCTLGGGISNAGTVFELSRTNVFTTLASFNGANGNGPGQLLLDASGNLFGTTRGGGTNSLGTVFEVASNSHAITPLASFTSATGQYPSSAALVADAAGNFYGTATSGGTNGLGTVFKVAAGSHALTAPAAFNGANGASPKSGLLPDGHGNFFGTTSSGGSSSNGTVFEFTNTIDLLAVASFTGANGSAPQSGLIADASGNFYGVTATGGPSDDGTIFEVAAGTKLIKTLASFSGDDGATPYPSLVADAAGDLFGTTEHSGASNFGRGTVFELVAGTNQLVTLVSFNGINGTQTQNGLIFDSSGDLFGTTTAGGTTGYGTIFELTPLPAPEPATLALVVIGAVVALSRPRRTGISCN